MSLLKEKKVSLKFYLYRAMPVKNEPIKRKKFSLKLAKGVKLKGGSPFDMLTFSKKF